MRNVVNTKLKGLVALAVLLFAFSGILSAQKIAIIDAGSSGSRLFVYEVAQSEVPTIKLLFPITPEQRKGAKGRALSSIANHTDSVRVFLENMTAKFQSEHTGIYILATAGMRLKPEAQAEAIYEKLRNLGTVNGYEVKGAMTISGQYEGLYGWLAANYDHGNIDVKHAANGNELMYTDYPHGILEIGGASMQLAFTTSHKGEDCLYRPGLNYIYSKSYLGGGVDQIFKHSKRKGNGYKFKLDIKDVSDQYQSHTWFMGLGIPVNNVIKGISEQDQNKSYRKRINTYIKSLNDFEDTMKNYHPRINSHYIKWVSSHLNLNDKLIQPFKDSSWTLGAALDILINKEVPERYDHQLKN